MGPYITPDLVGRLDGNGHFILPEPAPPGPKPILSPSGARAVAQAFVRTFLRSPNVLVPPNGLSFRENMEHQHGATIDWRRVEASDEIWFARGYLHPLPDSVPRSVHNHWGPSYLIPLLSGDTQVGALSVAGYATDVIVGSDGLLRMPAFGGNEFRSQGVSTALDEGLPVTPEFATKYVAEAVDARVAAVPEMMRADVLWVPFAARWRITLDRPVAVAPRSGGEVLETSILYVGHFPSLADPASDEGLRLRIMAATAEQPTSAIVSYQPLTEPSDTRRFNWPILPHTPTAFVEVLPLR